MKTKLTPVRFTDEDLLILDACQEHVGVQSRSETLRAVMRAYARAEGIKLRPAPKAKPSKSVTK